MWPFSRKKPPQILDRRAWNEDWQIGDLAECMTKNWIAGACEHTPRLGEILRVNAIREAVSTRRIRAYYLSFDGKPQADYWECTAFRKLRTVNEPANEGVCEQLDELLRKKTDA